MVRCANCKASIIGETKWTDWLSLMSFVECLRTEGCITDATAEEMTDKLLTFKSWAMEE